MQVKDQLDVLFPQTTCILKALFLNPDFLINCLKLVAFGFNCKFNHAVLRLFGLYDDVKNFISLFSF